MRIGSSLCFVMMSFEIEGACLEISSGRLQPMVAACFANTLMNESGSR